MGQEFEGEAFKPTPAVVLFKDFEVGQTYRQAVTLTNVSLARNTFKVASWIGPHNLARLVSFRGIACLHCRCDQDAVILSNHLMVQGNLSCCMWLCSGLAMLIWDGKQDCLLGLVQIRPHVAPAKSRCGCDLVCMSYSALSFCWL